MANNDRRWVNEDDRVSRITSGGRLPSEGGGGTYDGMGPWESSVEKRLDTIETKLGRVEDRLGEMHYWILGAAAGTVIALGGIIFAMESFKADMFQSALSFIQASQNK